MTYVPPFLRAYCERYEGSVWNGCWAETTARAIDAITRGRISGLTEADVRAVAGKPDNNLHTDGGTVDDQAKVIAHFVPDAAIVLRPTSQQLRDGLAAGAVALIAGNEHDAPLFDRPLDPAFYDRGGGHAIYVQGLEDGRILWGNPEEFLGAAPDYVDWAAVDKFTWHTGAGREAVLLPLGGDMEAIILDPAQAIGDLTLTAPHYVHDYVDGKDHGEYPAGTVWPVFGIVPGFKGSGTEPTKHYMVQPPDLGHMCLFGAFGGDYKPRTPAPTNNASHVAAAHVQLLNAIAALEAADNEIEVIS